jgi:hypothetical protein
LGPAVFAGASDITGQLVGAIAGHPGGFATLGGPANVVGNRGELAEVASVDDIFDCVHGRFLYDLLA